MSGRTHATVAALGDLMLIGEWNDEKTVKRALLELRPWLKDALVFANLETTVGTGDGEIAKWPRVIAAEDVLQAALLTLEVDVVNLANNHAFDALDSGFDRVRETLDGGDFRYFGAGHDLAEARRPVLLERHGIRFGWLGAASTDTRPSHLATEDAFGIRPLDESALIDQVEELLSTVDHVIVSLHWGVEFCHLPSPDQVRFARALIDHGVTLVLGHHAHVIQGVEAYGRGLIAYGLGNATTADFYRNGRLTIRQNDRTRSSLLLRAVFSSKELVDFDLVPLRCEEGRILVDDAQARNHLRRANRELARGATVAAWKRRRVIEDVFLRTFRKLHPAVIGSVRWKHVKKFFLNAFRGIRGEGPV